MIPCTVFSVKAERSVELCRFTLMSDGRKHTRVILVTNILDNKEPDGDNIGQLTLTLSEFHTLVQQVNRIDSQLKETVGNGEYWSEGDYE